MKISNTLFENWWLLPLGCLLISAAFCLESKLDANNFCFHLIDNRYMVTMFCQLLTMLMVLICALRVCVLRSFFRRDWKWIVSIGLILTSMSLFGYFIMLNNKRIIHAYNSYVACLFGEPDNSALLPNASDVKIRSLGEITHGGECIFLQGSQGSYKLIASINTHAPGRIYLNVVETSTGLKLSSRNIKKNTTKKVVYSNNTNEWFAHDSAFIISEGKRNKSFAAKFELWFSPSDGNDEYVIWSSIYRISGIN